jgi:hypothetical protein
LTRPRRSRWRARSGRTGGDRRWVCERASRCGACGHAPSVRQHGGSWCYRRGRRARQTEINHRRRRAAVGRCAGGGQARSPSLRPMRAGPRAARARAVRPTAEHREEASAGGVEQRLPVRGAGSSHARPERMTRPQATWSSSGRRLASAGWVGASDVTTEAAGKRELEGRWPRHRGRFSRFAAIDGPIPRAMSEPRSGRRPLGVGFGGGKAALRGASCCRPGRWALGRAAVATTGRAATPPLPGDADSGMAHGPPAASVSPRPQVG